MEDFKTTNNLDFEVAESPYPQLIPHKMFRVGTCEGQWGSTNDSFFIMSIENNQQGNGHLNDVLEWFEYSAKEYNKNLIVLECMNKRFYEHLINKRGFVPMDAKKCNCIKIFNKKEYKILLRKGNPIIKRGTLDSI